MGLRALALTSGLCIQHKVALEIQNVTVSCALNSQCKIATELTFENVYLLPNACDFEGVVPARQYPPKNSASDLERDAGGDALSAEEVARQVCDPLA